MKRDPHLVRLSSDHHHGLVLARRIQNELPNASDDTLANLYSDLLSFWAAGLLPHFRAENECLLTRLIRHLPPGHEAITRTQQDHLGIEALVATMRDTTDPAVRRTALAAFGTRLREHIRWEEAVLFQATQSHFTPAELQALGDEVQAMLGPSPAFSA